MAIEFTLTLKDLILLIIGIGGIVLIIYLIILFKKLTVTIDKANKILDDTNVVTSITASRATEVNGVVDDVIGALGSVATSVKGNQSTMAAVSTLINAIGSLRKILKKS